MNKKTDYQNSKTVFVTGASGFVGRALVDRLLQGGYRLVVLARHGRIPAHLKRPKIRLLMGDIRQSKCLAEALDGVDYVVHAAATMRGDWNEFFQTNVLATERLLDEAAKRSIKRFVYISSASIYAHSTVHNGEAVFTENMAYETDEFTTFYSKSKIAAEQLVWRHAKAGLPCVILRPGAIYGPGGHLFPATLGLGMGEKRIILIGDSRSQLPLSYVENVAEVVARALQQENVVGECFNLTEDRTLSREEYVKLIKTEIDPQLSVLRFPLWFMFLLKSILKKTFGLIGRKAPLSALNLRLYSASIRYSNEKYKAFFPSPPAVGFDESLKQTVAWHVQKRTPQSSSGLGNGRIVIPSRKKLNVGVIGCGNIAHVHLSILKQLENAGNIFVADPQEAALKNIGDRFAVAKTYPDFHDLLDKERLDVVHVLAPPQYHSEIAIAAAEKGCHALVEKPMAVDAAQAHKMIEVADRNGVKLGVVHNHLYDRVMLQAAAIVSQGTLGQVTFVESWYGTQYSAGLRIDPEKYWGYALPGSLYQDFLPHALYVLTALMGDGELKEVIATCSGAVPTVETDEMKILLQNENTLGLVSLSLAVSPRYQFINVFGSRGSMKVDLLNKTVLLDKEIEFLPRMLNRSLLSLKQSKALCAAGMKTAFNMFRAQQSLFEGTDRLIRLFYRSLLLDEPVPVAATEGLQVMRLMDQTWEKLKSQNSSPQKNHNADEPKPGRLPTANGR